jgi:DNA invertase Pin-like site-specific DNA recombinase
MSGMRSKLLSLNCWPREDGKELQNENQKDLQHAAGRAENRGEFPDASPLAAGRENSPVHSNPGGQANTLGVDGRRHSQWAQGESLAEAWPEGKAQERKNLMTTRVAIYGRVSTTNHGQDVGLQTRELEQFAQARGWRLVDSYLDLGISGSKDKRPELDRLMADAHRRKFDVVIVWKFDRFARSVSHLLRALETFNSLGIAFVSLSEQMDTTTPTGKMVFTVLGAVAELERSLIVERVRAGLRNARAKGKMLGRPRVAVDAARIGRLHAQGHSLREIASELGYSRSLVHKTLANRGSCGVAIAAD